MDLKAEIERIDAMHSTLAHMRTDLCLITRRVQRDGNDFYGVNGAVQMTVYQIDQVIGSISNIESALKSCAQSSTPGTC